MQRRLALLLALFMVFALALLSVDRSSAQQGPGHRLYVTDLSANQVHVVNATTGMWVGDLQAGAYGQTAAAVNQEETRLYITGPNDPFVRIIDLTGGNGGGSIFVGSSTQPSALALSPTGNHLYVTVQNGPRMVTFDTATGAAVGSEVAVGILPNGVAANPDGTRVYVSSSGDGAVTVIDAVSFQVVETIPPVASAAPDVRHIVVSPDGKRLFIAVPADALVRILDLPTRQYVGQISVGASASGLGISATGDRLYVSVQGPPLVQVYDVATQALVATFQPIGTIPYGIAVYPPVPRLQLTPTVTHTPTLPAPSATPSITSTATSTASPTVTLTQSPIPTAAHTPTLSPTSAPTLTVPPGVCAPRPRVDVRTSTLVSGRLAVSVSATTLPSTPTNWLRRIRFERLDNATVDVRGQNGQNQPFVVELPDRPTQVDFSVTRISSGPFTARLVVEDDCGEWRTFMGAGARAT